MYQRLIRCASFVSSAEDCFTLRSHRRRVEVGPDRSLDKFIDPSFISCSISSVLATHLGRLWLNFVLPHILFLSMYGSHTQTRTTWAQNLSFNDVLMLHELHSATFRVAGAGCQLSPIDNTFWTVSILKQGTRIFSSPSGDSWLSKLLSAGFPSDVA